jgi:hypothetical protein
MLTSLPPQREQGTYMAFNQLFVGVATALAPLLATSLPAARPAALWWALTGLSGLAALLALGKDVRAARSGSRGRPA